MKRVYNAGTPCAEGKNSDVFVIFPLNNCMLNDDAAKSVAGVKSNPLSQSFTGCSNGRVTIEQYSDTTCTTFAASVTTLLPTCNANDDASYNTMVCK